MRTGKVLRTLCVLNLLFCAAEASFGQTPPPSPVPLIIQVTPPSLSPANLTPGSNSFTLTILGANFAPGEVVTLTGPDGAIAMGFNPTVNSTGTQMVVNFANVFLPIPGTLTVTVTKRANTGAVLEASNPYYLPVTPSNPTVVLEAPVTSFLQGYAKAVATADFNGDGLPDLAVISQGPSGANAVTILTGGFLGLFTTGASYPTGNAPSGIVAADFDGDHIVDLAVTNAMDNTVMIFLGNGDGTFRPGTTISDPGVYPTQIVAADFNGDGYMDLAVLNACGTGQNGCYPTALPLGPENVAILLGNGDGTFNVAPTMPATGFVSTTIAAADLNQDGFIDLIVANSSNNLTLLMGNGDGTFTAASSTPSTGFTGPPLGIAVGDFNGDGALDVAVTSSGDNAIAILLNQNCAQLPAPACTLTPKGFGIALGTGASPGPIATADMNGDGLLDLVVANSGTGTVSVLLGDGTGNFNPLPWPNQSFPAGGSPQALALLDFNQDGRLDVMTLVGGGYSKLQQEAVMQVTLTTNNGIPLYGQFLQLTATLNPPFGQPMPTGTVTFYDGNTSLGSAVLSGYQAIFQFGTLTTGNHQITAVYNGDGNFLSSASNAVTEVVTRAQTTITLTSNINGVPFGQPFTLTATVQPQNTGTPTGIVDFYDTSTQTFLSSVTLANGAAQLTLSNLSPGPHVITAGYEGDSNFMPPSFQPTYQENITQASTTISVTASASPILLGQTPTFTATVQPGVGTAEAGAVLFFADGSPTPLGSATLTNNTAQLRAPVLSVGPHSIYAQYIGDTNYTGSTSSPILEMVNPSADTVTVSANPIVYGQQATLVATVQGVNYSGTPTGTITFSDGSTILGVATLSNGSAQFTASGFAVAPHPISASYSGDANFQPATSSQTTEYVLKANTTTAVTSGQNPSSFGQQVLLTATVQPAYGGTATGTVTFMDGSTSLGTSPLSGNTAVLTVSSFSGGGHSITASYVGDSNVNDSASTAMTQTVNPSPTSVTLTSNANPSTYGQNVTFTATAQAAFGIAPPSTISFYDGTTLLGTFNTVKSAQITIFTSTAGAHSITAQYAGTSNYAASTSVALTQTVNPSATTLSVSASPNPSSVGQSVTLYGTLQSTYGLISTGGTITFYNNSTQLGSVVIQANNIDTENGTYQVGFVTVNTAVLPAGSQNITAKYSGDPNLQASTGSTTQTVNPAFTNVTVTANPGAPTYGQNVTFTATLGPSYGNTPTGTVTFSMNGTTLATASVTNNAASFSISTLSPGNHIVNAVYSGDASDASNTNFVGITVAPPPTTTVLTSSVNPSYLNQPVVLVATPQSSVSGTPTGTMTLYDGIASLGSSTLVSGSAHFSISSLSVGTHSFTATYSGDFNFAGSTSAALSQVVNLGPTVTSVTSLDNPMTTPYNVRFLVTATATYGGTPSGTVTLYDGSTGIGSGILTSNPNGNTVEIVVSGLTAGSHSITAKYSGSASYGASTSSVLTQIMNLPGTTTSLSTTANPVAYGQSVTLTASLVPGPQPQGSPLPSGTVTFFDGSTSLGNGTVANNSAQLNVSSLAAGSHALTAKYNGDSNYTGSTSMPFTETVNQASTTATVSSSANPAAYGQSVTLTVNLVPAYGGSATGTIAFLDGTNSLGSATLSNNSAQFTISTLTGGAHSVTAKYSGDANFTASTSSAFTETINPAATTTAVISSLSPSVYGQSVSLTATVQPPSGVSATGTMTFFDGSNSLGSATLSGNSAQLAVTSLTTGSHSITAVYNGNSNLNGSTSVVLTQTVSQASTTTTVTANPNPSTFNQSVTFVITAAPANGGAPTGTVTLLDGSNTLVSASLSGTGTAQVTYGGLAPGAHSITAVYAGDANFTGSTSATVSETVNQASSTTSVASNLDPSVYNQAVTLTATVQAPQGITPFGTVTFMDGSTTLGSASLSNGSAQLTLSGLATGSHTITAVYAGNTYLTGSTSAALTQTVSQAATTTTITSGANPAVFGQSVTFSVKIQSSASGTPTGTVTLMDGSTSLGNTALPSNGVVQFAISSLAPGAHTISASYSGDANYGGSTSSSLTETVNPASSTVSTTASPNPATVGQAVTLTASVTPSVSGDQATGAVTFFDGSTSLGTANLSNNAAQISVSNLTVGSHSITATYAGDANVAGSTSTALTETINQVSTTTALASSLNPAPVGQSVTFTATLQAGTGNSATGTIAFFDGSTSLGTATVSNNSAQVSTSNLAPGSHSITAVYSGSTNFAGSTSAVLTQTINQIATTTTVASNVNPALAGQAVSFTATVQAGSGNSPTGTVNFMDGSSSLGTATLNSNSAQLTVSTLGAGTHTITAVYSGSTDFSGSNSAALTETVNQSSTTTTLVSNLNPATFGQAVPFVAMVQTASGGATTGSVTFYDGSSQIGTATVSNNGGHNVAQFTFSGLLGGTHTITAAYSGDANYTASTSGALTETINPASSTVTVGASPNPATFGQAVILTATVVPSVTGTQATGAVTFFDGANSLGAANLSSNNAAQISVSNFALGSHSITATYAGDRNFTGSTSAAVAEVVNPAATSTVVITSANPSLVNSSVTFTATVSSSTAGTQSGTVNFYLDGSGTAAASVNLSNGTAKYSTNSLSAGNHSVVAVFTSTNPDFSGSTSSPFTQSVSDFTVAVSPSSLTVARSTSGTYMLTVTPIGEFSGTVSLTCGGVPGGTTCAISPTQVILSSSSAQATVTITAAQNASKGTHNVTFTGTSGGLNHKITASLTID